MAFPESSGFSLIAPIAAAPIRPTAKPPAIQEIPTAAAAAMYFHIDADELSDSWASWAKIKAEAIKTSARTKTRRFIIHSLEPFPKPNWVLKKALEKPALMPVFHINLR
jgi:hypothetical protein